MIRANFSVVSDRANLANKALGDLMLFLDRVQRFEDMLPSLTWGAIRQLVARLEVLEARLP